MKITYISLFPEFFESFLKTSLIAKGIEKNILEFGCVNPRDFCHDRHKQVDDEIYGGGAGLLIKAQPMIDALKAVITTITTMRRKVLLISPAEHVFEQRDAHDYAETLDHLILVCGRYEGIDHRFELWCERYYGDHFQKVSLGTFVTLGGEAPAIVMTESIVRLLPTVIKEEASRQDESYRIDDESTTIEYPQYTRPEEVEGMRVPEVLLHGNHAAIAKRREDNRTTLS